MSAATDRELLELAAKAAGYSPAVVTDDGVVLLRGVRVKWSPLTDDGDRYRLAKALDIRIHFGQGYVTYSAGGTSGFIRWPEDAPDDAMAIVRAAAEIGKAMP